MKYIFPVHCNNLYIPLNSLGFASGNHILDRNDVKVF